MTFLTETAPALGTTEDTESHGNTVGTARRAVHRSNSAQKLSDARTN